MQFRHLEKTEHDDDHDQDVDDGDDDKGDEDHDDKGDGVDDGNRVVENEEEKGKSVEDIKVLWVKKYVFSFTLFLFWF